MTEQLYIKMDKVRKVYPRTLSAQISAVAKAAIGHLNVITGDHIALDNMTLTLREGDRVGIIGRNGAGKSTMLQLLAGVIEPSAGTLNICGKVTAVLTLGVGLREDLTGRENIYLDGEAQGKTREEIDGFIKEIIEFAELGQFIDLQLRTYSTGMKARLAFAMITQIDPEILIIDEALSVGDAAFSAKAGRRIAELCAKGAIVLIVSHSMQSINDLCNRCLWLDNGKLIMDDVPQNVTEAYIKSVRETDESEHMARFRSLVGVRIFEPEFNLTELKILSEGQALKKIMSGSTLKITCEWQKPENENCGKMHLRCIRLDGAFIYEHLIDISENTAWRKVSINYPNFNLSPGIYRILLQWQDIESNPRVESSTVIEVVADEVPSGGRPVLLDIGHIETQLFNEVS